MAVEHHLAQSKRVEAERGNTLLTYSDIGFGSSNTTGFGANKPAFGSTTGTTGGSGFGGFGSNAQTNTPSGFGSGASSGGGGLFGGTKPTFGSTATGGLFGSGGSSGGGFGSNTQSAPFGASGPVVNVNNCQGTGSTPFQVTSEKENNTNATNNFQSISFMQPYQMFSFEVRI